MNDEIKEILDNTLEYLEGIDETRNIKILTTNETNILLDYITNLQQKYEENERLKNMLDDADSKNLSLIVEINDRQDIIDKAIEYIENQTSIFDKCYFSGFKDLLNILQNGSEEK